MAGKGKAHFALNPVEYLRQQAHMARQAANRAGNAGAREAWGQVANNFSRLVGQAKAIDRMVDRPTEAPTKPATDRAKPAEEQRAPIREKEIDYSW